MKGWLAILLALSLILSAVGREDQTDMQVAWLKKNALPLRTLDPKEDDFTDLEPFRKVIGESRIVQLGEQSHGDGATFHVKARIIKFLHQKMGFDVLAMESGLYDCHKAWSLLKGGMEPREALNNGIFRIWMASEQFKPIVDYVGQAAKSDKPLELCGVDCQFTALASKNHLEKDVNALLDKLDKAPKPEVRQTLLAALEGMKQYKPPEKEEVYQQRKQAILAWVEALNAALPTKELSKQELAFWRQFAASAAGQLEVDWSAGPKKEFREKSSSLRDEQMACNLVWLAQKRYPKRKIIVWAATFHLMRNQREIGMLPGMNKDLYMNIATMGHEAWKTLGKETYTLAFIAAEGEAGLPWRAPWKLQPARNGSLEQLCETAGLENAFIDFRGLDASGDWLRQKLMSRPLGHSDMLAVWPNHFDGVLFTRKMYPSTQVKLNQ
jgi:erythromycin esterase